MSPEESAKTLEYLNWALAIIDDYYQRTGEIGFAEVIVYKAAKAHCKKFQENNNATHA